MLDFSDLFGSLAGRALILIDFVLILLRNRSFWVSGWPALDFHGFPFRSLLEIEHFGALAGQGSIFIEFLLNSHGKSII